MLKVEGITKSFGGVIALNNVSFNLDGMRIIGLIGPNGSGKSTLFNIICGLERADKGEIYFQGKKITNAKPYKISSLGVSRLFQQPRVFAKLSVMQNLLAAGVALKGCWMTNHAEELLKMVGLFHMKNKPAGELSHGQKRLVEICRALVSDPKIILMDEPFSGLHPSMVNKIVQLIKEFSNNVTFFVISHNISKVMEICERVMVLCQGVKIAEGMPEEIRRDQKVISAYLGEKPERYIG